MNTDSETGKEDGHATEKLTTKAAYLAVATFGIVSLLGDVTYEGGRGIVPQYLSFLGASAVLVGAASGGGEFLGYAMRLVGGPLADRTRAYWAFIFLGYGLIASIPLLGLTRSIEVAILLVLVERMGKGLRTPSRDTVISVVSKGIGAGKAFGIHEFMDQMGGISGPALMTALLFYTRGDYSVTLTALFVPYAALVAALFYAHRKVGNVARSEAQYEMAGRKRLGRGFYMYSGAVALNTVGLVPIALILFRASTILPQTQRWLIPTLYLVAQAVDAPIALVSGVAFDRVGIKILVVPFALSFLPSLFFAGQNLEWLILASVAFGVVLGMQESVYRAAIPTFADLSMRGTAYGIFNTVLGIGFVAAGLVFGFFLDRGVPQVLVMAFVAASQVPAILLLLRSARMSQAKES